MSSPDIKSFYVRFLCVFRKSYLLIVMGRKKFRTEEEKHELNKKWRMRYYWKHIDEERKKARERYHKNKRNIQDSK